MITGASGRNWAGYGGEVRLPEGFDPADQALLTDPQTSGGLLVTCAADAADEALRVFQRHGFDAAAVIGGVGTAGASMGLYVN
jgi:selenide,water dikinase